VRIGNREAGTGEGRGRRAASRDLVLVLAADWRGQRVGVVAVLEKRVGSSGDKK
jgi:hypothetical protein